MAERYGSIQRPQEIGRDGKDDNKNSHSLAEAAAVNPDDYPVVGRERVPLLVFPHVLEPFIDPISIILVASVRRAYPLFAILELSRRGHRQGWESKT